MSKLNRFLLLGITFSNCFIGQAQYVYSDTISFNLTISPKQKDSMYLQLQEKGFSEITIQDIIETMSRNTNLQLVKGRTVTLRNDTSFVELNYFNTETETFNLKNNKFVMVNGKLYSENTSTGKWETGKAADSTITFAPTGKTRKILEFDCIEYVSLDNAFTVWVNPTSKNTINPGIIHKNLPGAIWGFHANRENSSTRSQLIRMPVQ